MPHHLIILDTADSREASYGITHHSRHVYRTTKSHGPTRLKVWDNTSRLNPDRGKHLGEPIGGGNTLTKYSQPGTATATYIDPKGNPTDDAVTILLSPESSAITSNGTNTGTVASRQVYHTDVLGDGDTATLSYPDGTYREATIHFPPYHNGHGYATFK